jgi:two-component system OmpR family response regulator
LPRLIAARRDPPPAGRLFFSRGRFAARRAAPIIAAGEDAMGRSILLVEDDRETAAYLVRGLGEEGHVVEHVADGRDGLFLATGKPFDLIILDRMVPALDGLSVLRALRAAAVATPVLILSALASVSDRIEGLESGSDDYLVKPFSFAELLARVNALLRRSEARTTSDPRLVVGDLEIDPLSRVVRRAGRTIELKPREYRLLEFLARNEGRVVTRTMLLEQVWDYHFDPGTNVIDVHVSRLRRKLEDGFERPILHTVRGAGYRLGQPG